MENTSDIGFMSFDSDFMARAREDEGKGGSDDSRNASPGKKNQRHTPHQVRELENAFKDNPHPDDEARKQLGNKLGLEERQVKFWFQNKRTQMKSQTEHDQHTILKEEHDKLLIENMALKEAMKNSKCRQCGWPIVLRETADELHVLMIENAWLKNEINGLGVQPKDFMP